ncbi:hypothetical protein [Tautonia plasticadhaerens]|uniref:Uncharacterized protein n=1 Tax=Tautonia plasticadhaerens TaxID=2527974 RepID=A0A518HDG6_9BACT|nr:hypothetical protein [Tautonia plasticadhaerens]QDV38901.1 hypothetical protein ElP_68610 [Tautonia plasticadhaerens]
MKSRNSLLLRNDDCLHLVRATLILAGLGLFVLNSSLIGKVVIVVANTLRDSISN